MSDNPDESSGKKKSAIPGSAKLYRAANFDFIRKRVEAKKREHEQQKADAIKRAATPLQHVESSEKTSFEKFRQEAEARELVKRRQKSRLPGAIIFWIFVAIIAAGAWLRFADLGEKPLHSDEAVQAYKLGELLEGDGYVYDPADHHGPTLYYFAAIACRLAGENSFAELTAPVLRFVPALFGVGLIAAIWFWRGTGVRRGAICAAAAFAAMSPVAVYYARYFIQETILVACFWSAVALMFVLYSKNNYKTPARIIIASIAGVLFGVAIASKETWILMLPAVLAGIVAQGGAAIFGYAEKNSSGRSRFFDNTPARISRPGVFAPACLTLAAAGITAALFYSSFGKNPAGITEAITAYAGYFDKAAGGAHDKPFWWYLPEITAFKIGNFRFLSEALTLLAGVVFGGLLLANRTFLKQRERRIFVFSLVAGITLFLVYSFIGYKTPWLILGVLPPLWLAAGIGCAGIFTYCLRKNKFRPAVFFVPACGLAFLILTHGFSARRLSIEPLASDERNLLAYVHTSPDVLRAVELSEAIASITPSDDFRIFVYSEEAWPLPWYFRALPAGFWEMMPAEHPVPADAPVVITDSASEPAVAARLNAGDYIEDFFQLRPGVLLNIRLRRDLHERYMFRKLYKPADLEKLDL